MDLASIIAQNKAKRLRRGATGFRCRVVSTLNLPPLQLQGASLWVAGPRVETLIFVHIPEERWKFGKRRSMGKNTGWKPMLHWFSGLLGALSEPFREFSPCTRSGARRRRNVA